MHVLNPIPSPQGISTTHNDIPLLLSQPTSQMTTANPLSMQHSSPNSSLRAKPNPHENSFTKYTQPTSLPNDLTTINTTQSLTLPLLRTNNPHISEYAAQYNHAKTSCSNFFSENPIPQALSATISTRQHTLSPPQTMQNNTHTPPPPTYPMIYTSQGPNLFQPPQSCLEIAL